MTCAIGVIPARLKSSRLPNKPLYEIEGRSLISYTLSNLANASLNEIIVLADEAAIVDHVKHLGYRAELSPIDCASGLERICARRELFKEYDRIIHMQCDEPTLKRSSIDALAQASSAPVSTLACLIDEHVAANPANVKVVLDRAGRAMYFSRAPIPYPRDGKASYYLKHIGAYAYTPDFLDTYMGLKKGKYETIEMLEQLTLLENRVPIDVHVVRDHPIGIDTPQDIDEFKLWLRQNTSSSQAASSPLSAKG
jgi:3-deoxy-manno-octulosonate cytidylyltransferase (CMP-KDO synthetase)